MVCLRTELPEVKAQLDRYAEILGSENIAYYVLSENNGYDLDIAPNGEQSKLYQDLLQLKEGNEREAIIAKARTYYPEFRNWFGDWLSEDKEDVSKVVDQNGEPLIVYHHALSEFSEFSIEYDNYFSTAKGGTKKALFFTGTMNPAAGTVLDRPYKMPVFLNAKSVIEKTGTKDELRESGESFVSTINKAAEEADAAIFHGIDDNQEVNQDIYVINNPNNVKSIDNRGTFSQIVNNIYAKEYDDVNKKHIFTFEERVWRSRILGDIVSGRIQNSTQLIDKVLEFHNANRDNENIPYTQKDTIFSEKLIDLLKLLRNVPCKVNVSYDKPVDKKDTLAFYDGEITFYDDTIRNDSLSEIAETLAHELLHHYLSKFLHDSKNIAYVKEFQEIKDQLLEYIPKDSEGKRAYGLNDENISEFINEFMSNWHTRQQIYDAAKEKDTQTKNEIEESKNAWQKLIDFFIKILKQIKIINNQDESFKGAEYQLDQMYDTIERLILKVNSGEIETYKSQYEFLFSKEGVSQFNKESTNINDTFPNEQDYNNTMRNVEQSFNEGVEYNQQNDTEESRKDLDAALERLTEKILEGQQKRLKVIDDPDPSARARAKKEMEWQIANITNNLVDNITNITNFVNSLRDELKENIAFLQEHINNNIPIDNKKLNDLRSNFFDFYLNILDDIRTELVSRADYRELIGKTPSKQYILDVLLEKTNNYKKMIEDGSILVNREITKNATTILRDLGLQLQDPTVFSYITSNPEPVGDMSWFTYAIGAGDKIKDTSIKSIFYLVNEAEQTAKRNSYPRIQKLTELLEKARAAGFSQADLFEFDENGNPTGNIVRERNYGKMWQNYQKAMNEICMQLGLDPSDLTLPENRTIRLKYNELRNAWLNKHVERQFTKEYYDLFNNLSQEARDQREQIQSKIRTILDRVRDDKGIPQIFRLSSEDYQEYQDLLREKKQLASIYDINGKRKQGIALQVAEELTELNEKLQKNLEYKANMEAFNAEKQRILNDKNLTKEQKQEWLRRNQRVRFKQEFWDLLSKVEKKKYGAKYEAFSSRRRAILNQYRDANGDINNDAIPPTARAAINALEHQMRIIHKGTKNAPVEGELEFKDVAKVVPTEQYYIDRKKQAALAETDPELFDMWSAQNEYVYKDPETGKRKVQPKAWYTKLMPVDESMIEYVPSSEWMEISDKSSFYNKEYAKHKQQYPSSQDEWWIPKSKVYDDKGNLIEDYDTSEQDKKINDSPELKALREELVAMLKESYQKYGNLNRIYPYRMPQISGSIYRYMKAGWKKDGIVGAFQGFKQFFKDKFSTDTEEVGLHETATKPNGEPLNIIPQYYMRNLKDRAVISADLVGDVAKFYYQSELWYQKTLIQPKVEILKQYLKGRIFKRGGIKVKNSRMAKFAQEFINMNLYDVQTQQVKIKYGDNPSGKLLGLINYKGSFLNIPYDISGKKEFDVTKALRCLRVLGTARNLALNIPVALTGFTTALHSHIINSLIGRYYNVADFSYGIKDIVYDIMLTTMRTIGLSKKRSKLSQLMEIAEIGAEFMLPPTNRNKLLDSINRHWGFGLYTLSDHLIKGQIFSSVMHNFKLVKNQKGEYTFMCREDYNAQFPDDYKHTHNWMLDNAQSFYDCIELNAGKIVAKDPTLQKTVEEAFKRISNLSRNLSASADGQLTNLQKNVLQSSILGQFFMMHRQYLPVILQERYLMTKQFDYQSQTWREGIFQSPIRLIQTASIQNQSILKTFKQLYRNDPVFRENILKIGFEIMSFQIIDFLIKPFIQRWADEDKRNWLKQLLAYVIERTSFEVYAPYNLFDMMKIINDPFAIANYVNNYINLMTGPLSIASDGILSLINEDFQPDNNIITRGAYRGWSKFEQQLFKLTPFKNIYELQDIQAKRNYYQKQIAGN